MGLTKFEIAQRISQELKNGYYVNLGIGMPELVSQFVVDIRIANLREVLASFFEMPQLADCISL